MYCHSCGVQLQPGANFCSGCGAKMQPARAPGPSSGATRNTVVVTSAARSHDASEGNATPGEVKVLDAGEKILISSEDQKLVEKTLARYLVRGSIQISALTQVGKSWVASCSIPTRSAGLDDTQSLKFADLAAYGARTDSGVPVDGCRVEEVGLKRLVYGPTRRAVEIRVAHITQYGGQIVGEIEQQGEEWIAICDFGDAKNTGYKW